MKKQLGELTVLSGKSAAKTLLLIPAGINSPGYYAAKRDIVATCEKSGQVFVRTHVR